MSAALAIATLIPALFQSGLGIYQNIQANKWAKTPVPEYKIPEALNTAVGMQRRYAQSDMPGTQSMISEQRQSGANAISEMSRYGMIDPNMVNKVYGQESENIGKIGLANEEYRLDEKNTYLQMLSMLAEQQGKKFDWEVLLPYQQEKTAESALRGASIQNQYGAFTSLADKAGSMMYLESMGYDPMGDMFNKNKNKSEQYKYGEPTQQILDIARAGGAYNDGSSNWSNSNSNVDLGFMYNTLFKNNMLNFQG